MQTMIALSTGESEFYALVKATSVAIGLQNMARHYGLELGITLKVDATAGRGIASRRGVGKIRHLSTQTLWVQRLVQDKVLGIQMTPGDSNPSDLGTKHVEGPRIVKLLQGIRFFFESGSSAIALKAAVP